MISARAVIGANFGDEGKGLITDFLAAPFGGDALIVRHNGGAQAGHTVTTPDGQRHVFSHFGSGSFCGSATLLSRFFVCNPLLFFKERGLLQTLGLTPVVYADRAAPVTTPYDMMINQIVEDSRGDKRHGSCGVGFGETLGRQENSPYTLNVADLEDTAGLKEKLHRIRDGWVDKRLQKLGIPTLPEVWRGRLFSNGVIEKYLSDTAFFLAQTTRTGADFLAQTKQQVIFEGAQGLLLDQTRGSFPHVTRSHTGIRNAAILATEAGFDALDVTYITRSYATRHGAGPLPHALAAPPYKKARDDTNVPHPYQGNLRYAPLDADLLAKSIRDDLTDAGRLKITHNLAVTCLDQVDDDAIFMDAGQKRRAATEEFVSILKKKTAAAAIITSYGPTRKDVSAQASGVFQRRANGGQ